MTGFTLRADAAEVLQFRVRQPELDGGVSAAAHLFEHAATLQPVAVECTLEDGGHVARRLSDAPGPCQSPGPVAARSARCHACRPRLTPASYNPAR